MKNVSGIIEQELKKTEFSSIRILCQYATDLEVIKFINNVANITANNILDKAAEIAFEEVYNNNSSASDVEQKILKLKKQLK